MALVIFGPNKLPELGKSLGQGIREFKKATQSISQEVTAAVTEDVNKAAAQPAPTQTAAAPTPDQPAKQ